MPLASPEPMLAIYGRAVTWRHLILTSLLLLVLMGGLSGAAAWWAWHHLEARVTLREHPARIVLPRELAVQAQVEQKVQVRLDHTLPVRVPIQQDLLITGERKGHAIKANRDAPIIGAIVGKALGSLRSGTGVIPVIVMLQ